MKKIHMLALLAALPVLWACGYKPEYITGFPEKKQMARTGLNSMTDSFLIGVYWPPVWEYVSDQQFQRLGDAHVDILQYVLGYSQAQNQTILDKCQQHHIKAIVCDQRTFGTDADIAAMVNAYKDHPGLAGYYIKDEPMPAQLDWAAGLYKKLLAADPQHLPHVNLLPSIATVFAATDYETTYMKPWIDSVGASRLKYLSLDIYPFRANGTFNDVYYTELDRLRRVAIEKGDIKTSAYLQSIGVVGAYRRPNKHELAYNVYSMLAYGVKHPVWFTYSRPENNASESFTDAILNAAGDTTDLYMPFKQLNSEMKQLGKKLIRLQSQAVYHTGASIPANVATLPADYFLQPANSSDNLLIAQMKDWSEGGRNYAMVVNKSLTTGKSVTLHVAGWITYMGEISKINGMESPLTVVNGNITLQLGPGEGRLFAFNPF